MRTRASLTLLLFVAGAGAFGSAWAHVASVTHDAIRLRDQRSAQGFGAEVCRYDVNGNGTDDFHAVYQSHLRPGAVQGARWPGEA
jgi:hypothetical protein